MFAPTETRCSRRSQHERGFSIVQQLMVVAVALVLAAIAIPSYSNLTSGYSVINDSNKIMGELNQARMRAAADFARIQLSCSSSTSICSIQTKQYGASTWTTETSQAVVLSRGVSFATPSGVSLGAGGQSAEAPYQGSSAQSVSYAIVFNSRGLPIVDPSGTSVSDYALYLKGANNSYMAVTVDVSGRPLVYNLQGTTWQLVIN
jgi:Tfp pilus assembly protein FimT